MTAPDQTNAEVSDERLRERADALWEQLLPHMQVASHASGAHSAYDDKVAAIGFIMTELTRRSVTSQASEGEVVFDLDSLGVGARVVSPSRKDRGIIAIVDDVRAYVDYPAGGGSWWPRADLKPWENWRDTLGRAVRVAWVKWAQTQPSPKAAWLVPYDDLSEPDKEADRQIGEALTRFAASPVSKRVERLEAALTDINRVLSETRTSPSHLVGNEIEWCIDHCRQALQGGRS